MTMETLLKRLADPNSDESKIVRLEAQNAELLAALKRAMPQLDARVAETGYMVPEPSEAREQARAANARAEGR